MLRMLASAFLLLVLALAGPPPAAFAAEPASSNPRRTPVVEVFERCRNAVVNIHTTRLVRLRSLRFGSPLDDIFQFRAPIPHQRESHSVGSGVVIHRDGFIVTNAHVIAQASDVRITLADRESHPAEIVAVDGDHDLAVLKVALDEPLPEADLAAAGDVLVGETVIAIGNPLGYGHSVSAGIISAVGRTLEFSEDKVYRDLIQTDAPINPGNSGGPLLNVNGELIGINTAIRGDAQNIGFAIPVAQVWDLLPDMLDIERRERVAFGLVVSGAEPLITAIRPDSPAADTACRVGDRLVAFNGEPLRSGIDYYVKLLDAEPGAAVALTLERDGQRIKAEVTLEAIPLPDGNELAQRLLGFRLQEISPAIRRKYDLSDYVRLVVDEIEPGSPADRAQMRRGDLILRLGRLPVENLAQVGLVLEATEPGDDLLIDGVRPDPFFSWSVRVRTRR